MRHGKNGIQHGILQGIEKGILETAIKMISNNIPIETIIDCTGPTKKK